MYGIHGFQIRIKDFLLTIIQVMIYISLTVLTLMKSGKKESHKQPILFKAKCQRLNYVMCLYSIAVKRLGGSNLLSIIEKEKSLDEIRLSEN